MADTESVRLAQLKKIDRAITMKIFSFPKLTNDQNETCQALSQMHPLAADMVVEPIAIVTWVVYCKLIVARGPGFH